MLVSYNWLKEFVDIDDLDVNDLAEKITRTGVEIADVAHPMAGLKKLVVGYVEECVAIEGTHLHKTLVDAGQDEKLQIVCGAPNVAAGEKVIVALHGARIAGGHKIKRGKIRGIESNGMICGLQEIGFNESVVPSEFVDGIYVFPSDADVKPGEDVYEALGMDDYIFDFDITPNRADTLSMEGAAYEVGAIVDKPVKIEPVVLKEDGAAWTDSFSAEIDQKLAPKYYLRKFSDITVKPSPLWMQTRLWNAGIRPINNVVDITNYVMLLTGLPMHAYDARTFKDHQVGVRLAEKGEKFTLLSDKKIELDAQDIVITDGTKPVALAGVMGGLNSEIQPDTTDVYLEVGVFDPTLIRKAALRHANRTEASSRFEKGVNWDNLEKAENMAALLLRNEAGATVAQGILKAADQQKEPTVIKTTVSYINKVLGTEISADEMKRIFDRLNFESSFAGDELTVNVPARRWDLAIPADLVEEVGRLYGYDNIKSTQPLLAETHGGYSEAETKLRRVKSIVQGQGLMEAISYSLTSPEKAHAFVKEAKADAKIKMPLNSSRSVMRQNLLEGLLDAASYNFARKENELFLFEQGRTYDREGGEFHEHEHLAALYSGHVYADNWQHEDREVDFYFVKGQLEELFISLGIKGVSYRAEAISGMHLTRTAGIYLDGEYLGMIGMIAPSLTFLDKTLRGHEIYAYELDLDVLSKYQTQGTKAVPAPKFPAIERDLSILVSDNLTNEDVEKVIRENAGKYLTKLQVIDVYQGEHIESGKKSLAYNLTFRNDHDTLTDSVVSKAMETISEALIAKLGANIR